MRPVYLVTAGQSKFDRAIPEKRTEELCIDALAMAARLIDKTPAELKSYIHSCYYGHFADHFGDQLLGEALIHDRLGMDPPGNVGIKTGGIFSPNPGQDLGKAPWLREIQSLCPDAYENNRGRCA